METKSLEATAPNSIFGGSQGGIHGSLGAMQVESSFCGQNQVFWTPTYAEHAVSLREGKRERSKEVSVLGAPSLVGKIVLVSLLSVKNSGVETYGEALQAPPGQVQEIGVAGEETDPWRSDKQRSLLPGKAFRSIGVEIEEPGA
eukprot:Gb_14204 [translate_table: standard]